MGPPSPGERKGAGPRHAVKRARPTRPGTRAARRTRGHGHGGKGAAPTKATRPQGAAFILTLAPSGRLGQHLEGGYARMRTRPQRGAVTGAGTCARRPALHASCDTCGFLLLPRPAHGFQGSGPGSNAGYTMPGNRCPSGHQSGEVRTWSYRIRCPVFEQ